MMSAEKGEGGSRNAYKEGKEVKKSKNYVEDLYGSPLIISLLLAQCESRLKSVRIAKRYSHFNAGT